MQQARVDYTDDELIEVTSSTEPLFLFEPGGGWRYSDSAFVLLGIVISRAANKPYAEFFQERLFAPIGLSHTSVDDAADVVLNRANDYTPLSSSPSGFYNASYFSLTFAGAAGSMRSTTGDLCHWHRALLNGEVLRPESLTQMFSPGRMSNGKLPTIPTGPEQSMAIEYGLGIGLRLYEGPFQGRTAYWHDGGFTGFRAYLKSFPEERVTIALVFNAGKGDATGYSAGFASVKDAAATIGLS